MKISEMQLEDVRDYLRIEPKECQAQILEQVMAGAYSYIRGYTGLSDEEMDALEDLTVAFLVLCQDGYDNRTMTPDTKYANSANRVVESILNLHVRNLL